MSIGSVKIALETALKAGLGTFPIGWENVAFIPPADGGAYCTVALLPANPENPMLSADHHREVGIMQVLLSYPLDGGSGRVYAKAETIRGIFARGSTFLNGGVTTKILNTASIGPGFRDADRFQLPIRIRYSADVFA